MRRDGQLEHVAPQQPRGEEQDFKTFHVGEFLKVAKAVVEENRALYESLRHWGASVWPAKHRVDRQIEHVACSYECNGSKYSVRTCGTLLK